MKKICLISMVLFASLSAFALSDFLEPVYISLYSDLDSNSEEVRVLKFGFNLDVDSTPNEDVWASGGVMTFTEDAETLRIVSSSANDTANGTGARSVVITGIKSDNTQGQDVVTLNGTTAVTSNVAFKFVNRVAVLSSGSNKKNAGNIHLNQSSSDIGLAYIPATYGVTQQSHYRVPGNYRCYINDLYVSSAKLAGSSPKVIFYVKILNTAITNTEYTLRREYIDTSSDTRTRFPNFKAQALLPNEIMTIEIDSDTNDTQATSTIDMTCRKI